MAHSCCKQERGRSILDTTNTGWVKPIDNFARSGLLKTKWFQWSRPLLVGHKALKPMKLCRQSISLLSIQQTGPHIFHPFLTLHTSALTHSEIHFGFPLNIACTWWTAGSRQLKGALNAHWTVTTTAYIYSSNNAQTFVKALESLRDLAILSTMYCTWFRPASSPKEMSHRHSKAHRCSLPWEQK